MTGPAKDGRVFFYDEENRLTSVTRPDGTPLLEIAYDALGRRVWSKDYSLVGLDPCTGSPAATPVTTRHVMMGLSTIEEYVSCGDGQGGTTWNRAREFVWGNRFPEPLVMVDRTAMGSQPAGVDETFYFLQDGLVGSTSSLTSADGTVVERYVYDAYGTTYIEAPDGTARSYSAVGNPFLWTGQRYDAGVKQYHFLARSYWPEFGRWLQRDPLGYLAGALNLYEPVFSNPLKYTDPDGKNPLLLAAILVALWPDTAEAPDPSTTQQEMQNRRQEQYNENVMNTITAVSIYTMGAGLSAAERATLDELMGEDGGGSTPSDGSEGGGIFPGGDPGSLEGGSPCGESPEPPGWDDKWTWEPPSGESDGGWRWWDEDGGEWRYHGEDKYHPNGDPHWDYNPWSEWNSKWRNVPIPQPPADPPSSLSENPKFTGGSGGSW